MSGSEDLDLDLAAAQIRADARDLGAFVDALAKRLEQAIPGQVDVDRKRAGLLSSRKVVTRIACKLGDESYELRRDGSNATAQRGKVVRGITIRTEELPVPTWAADLVDAIGAQAQTSAGTYEALRALVT